MPKFVIYFLLAFGTSQALAAQSKSVTCTFKIDNGKKTSATFKIGNDFAISKGLDFGDENYNFSLSSGDGESLDVTFYENNYVQDEVGSFNCEFDFSGKTFCQDKITNENGKVGNFSCVAKIRR